MAMSTMMFDMIRRFTHTQRERVVFIYSFDLCAKLSFVHLQNDERIRLNDGQPLNN